MLRNNMKLLLIIIYKMDLMKIKKYFYFNQLKEY